jgi:hypothetical protein
MWHYQMDTNTYPVIFRPGLAPVSDILHLFFNLFAGSIYFDFVTYRICIWYLPCIVIV